MRSSHPPSDDLPSDLDPAAIRARLVSARLGSEIAVLGQVDSTMDDLAARARAGAPEGSVVIADGQTAGRGRLGRAWVAPPGAALLLSILFRPDPRRLPPERAGEIPMAVALGALDAVAAWLPADLPAALKWPNDLIVAGGRAKLGGILAEARWSPRGAGVPEPGSSRADRAPPDPGPDCPAEPVGVGAIGEIIVGIGLNVRQSAAELPPGAASLISLSGVITSGSRANLAADLLGAADRYYAELLAGRRLVDRWAARLDTLGRDIVARRGATPIRGRAIGVAEDGALRVRVAGGDVVLLRAGDVTLAGV